MDIQICVGSSCHLNGADRLVERFQQAVAQHELEAHVALGGCFCTGQCNRQGVTVTVDGQVYPGVTPETFDAFFEKEVLGRLHR